MDNNLLNTIMAPFTQSNAKPLSHQSHNPQSFLHFKSNQIKSSNSNGKHASNKNLKPETSINLAKSNELTAKQSPTQSNEIATSTSPTANDNKKCIDNVHFNDLFQNTLTDSSSITMPQSIRNDPRLYKDDVDIRFSRTLNSCKLPQIRYASPERLFERLTDLRFLSIDFLNTFLLTYRVFTDGVTVLEALKKVHFNPDCTVLNESSSSSVDENKNGYDNSEIAQLDYEFGEYRRVSSTSVLSEQTNQTDRSNSLAQNLASQQTTPQHRESLISTGSDFNGQLSAQQLQLIQQQQQILLNRSNQHWRLSHRKTEIQAKERHLKRVREEDKDQLINQFIAQPEDQIIKQQPGSSSVEREEKQSNDAKQYSFEEDQLNVFNESTEQEKQLQICDKETNDKKTSTNLRLPLNLNLLSNPLSPDPNELFLPPPASPVNPAYSLKQCSRNKRYKVLRRLNSISGGSKNSSDDSDQQINQGSSDDEDDAYAVDSSLGTSGEEDELIDMESSEERTTKLYNKSDFEKLLSDTSEQDSLGEESAKILPDENLDNVENKDIFEKQLTNLTSPSAQSSNATNNLLSVQHSHSSEKLKSSDSQSSPNSPTVLSSAASSATLVASPLNKIAPEDLETVHYDLDNELDGKQKQENGNKDKNNNIPKAQPTVSFSDQVMKTSQSNQVYQTPIATSPLSRASTPKQTPQHQPQYFLWNQNQQSTNPFVANVDYQPHHKLSTASTTSGSSTNYLRVKGGKGLISETHNIILDSVNTTPRSSFQADFSAHTTPRSSFQMSETQQMMCSKAGVVVTSSRNSTRRSSSASAASAFAVATAASSNPVEPLQGVANLLSNLNISGSNYQNLSALINACGSNVTSRSNSRLPSIVSNESKILQAIQQSSLNHPDQSTLNSNINMLAQARMNAKRESVINTAATMRVLNVLRHWVSKHFQDFETDSKLMQMTNEFLEELVRNPNLLPGEHKVACQLLQMISKEDGQLGMGTPIVKKVDLNILLTPPNEPSKETLESLTALEIAENMTYLDHKIFIAIHSSEFLCQAWMKSEKNIKAPHILMMTKRFNEMSRLVASEIILANDLSKRVAVIEKWTNVADICRCLHNFNGVLQITSAFTNSSVFRLKRTWEKLTKSQKHIIEKLQNLTNTDGRFRCMRDALHRCDPPCIPYLGMYLADLSFIEEGTPNFTDDGLLNFSKMRMIAHVVREIKSQQNSVYKIEMNQKVVNYLLDTSKHLSDDDLYQLSLFLEPRLSRFSHGNRSSITYFPQEMESSNSNKIIK